MSKGPQTFRQRDVAAAIKAARAAGLEVERVEVDKAGKITIVTSKQAVVPVEAAADESEWDDEI